MSQELTCSSLMTSNYSEWRSTQRFLSTSTSLMSLASVTTTFVRCVTYVHSWHLMQTRLWRFPLLAVDLIIVTVFYIACRRLTLIGYSIPNVLAQVVAEAPWTISSTNIHRDLHWLTVNQHKLCLITRKTLHTTQSPYLSELIVHYLHILLTWIFWPDHTASLAPFHHGSFPFLHHLSVNLCLNTFAVSTNYQPSNAN